MRTIDHLPVSGRKFLHNRLKSNPKLKQQKKNLLSRRLLFYPSLLAQVVIFCSPNLSLCTRVALKGLTWNVIITFALPAVFFSLGLLEGTKKSFEFGKGRIGPSVVCVWFSLLTVKDARWTLNLEKARRSLKVQFTLFGEKGKKRKQPNKSTKCNMWYQLLLFFRSVRGWMAGIPSLENGSPLEIKKEKPHH